MRRYAMDKVFIDVRTSDLTLSEIFRQIESIQSDNPDMEIFLDGDRHAIVGRSRKAEGAER
jgi:hypothetical protein